MQAKQEAWSRAAQSSSGSVSPGSSAASRSPDMPRAPLHGRPKGKARDESKTRRKVAKACLACQKSHLTCDEKRPCTRCAKKGIGDQCVEGVRKKAKYLLEGDERAGSSAPPPTHASISPTANAPNLVSSLPVTIPQMLPEQQGQGQARTDDVWLSAPLDGGDGNLYSDGVWAASNPPAYNQDQSGLYPYGATAASTEYQMLDSMFSSMSPVFSNSFDLSSAPVPDQQAMQPDLSYLDPNSNTGVPPLISPNWTLPSSPNELARLAQYPTTQNTDLTSNPFDYIAQPPAPPSQADNNDGPFTHAPLAGSSRGLTPTEVYRNVVKPYDYTEGYHFLMEYLTQNFEQREVLRVVRSLASYRPSLIALQMPMSEEDEIFLERSFQRTLIELEKLISYSATPTAVFRRTGEVVYANPEFLKLASTTSNELMGNGRRYVYQLFAKHSVVEYWENFSVHAFENTTQNFFMSLGLVNPDSRQGGYAGGQGENGLGMDIKCSCCFTIRRDVFDLPSVVIGQFLPVPDA
ncbi:hypothetical protein BCR39DRAFT_564755 [Naematelia encephala]|uniref:Transcription activator of gluconeogenesis ERT1 n=1 Tax=Naematelia encephala TaxID=71784 RepID=A0A1Y2B884_9TREE|nr:hypothetical protein BCR39DRAFT_564755 [Naematelia encephala]